MGQAIEPRADQPFHAEHARPIFKREVRGYNRESQLPASNTSSHL